MAGVIQAQVIGLREVLRDVGKLGKIPGAILKQAVREKSEVTRAKMDLEASTRLQGPYCEGVVAASSVTEKLRSSGGNASCQINFKGTQHDNRVAEIAFVNEYGVRRTRQRGGRHFIRTATDDPATRSAGDEAAAKVIFGWMQQNGL